MVMARKEKQCDNGDGQVKLKQCVNADGQGRKNGVTIGLAR
jgi:hypothetical protein